MWNENMHRLWLQNMVRHNQPKGEVVSNCCCEKLIEESERCGKCKENCEPIYI